MFDTHFGHVFLPHVHARVATYGSNNDCFDEDLKWARVCISIIDCSVF